MLLLPGARPARAKEWYPGALEIVPTRLRGLAQQYRDRLQPDLTYKSPARRRLVGDFVTSLPRDAVIANVGSGGTNYGANVVNLDIDTFSGVDVVGVAENLPLKNGSCDGVILQAVLEHVDDAERVLAEIHRVLKTQGLVVIEVPFLQGYHPAPRDHRRYTEEGLRLSVEQQGFEVMQSGVAVGPGSAMAWVAAEFLALLVSGKSTSVYRYARAITRWLAVPIKYSDRWLDGHPMAHVVASGVWVVARRSGI